MNILKQILTVVSLTVISVLFLMTFTILAKDLPLLVDVSELGIEYDNKRVAVMGWARSAEVMRGRLGSNFVKAEVGEGGDQVTVFSDFSHYNTVDNRVIVQGVYHHEGRYGGLLADHFIVADAVVRDWEGTKAAPSRSPGIPVD